MANPRMEQTSLSGLSESEAKAFGAVFFRAFVGFVVIALVAHFLVWQWRPWIQP